MPGLCLSIGKFHGLHREVGSLSPKYHPGMGDAHVRGWLGCGCAFFGLWIATGDGIAPVTVTRGLGGRAHEVVQQ